MAKGKLYKFDQINSYPNVVQNPLYTDPRLYGPGGEERNLRGVWTKNFFEQEWPLVLELACGHGDYSRSLARMESHKNILGVDIKGNRIYTGARLALQENLRNVGFLRTRIEQINLFFDTDEVSEIWITFPDPFLRDSKENRRLTSRPFLDRYARILRPGGLIHLKTDSDPLFDFTLDVIHSAGLKIVNLYRDLYAEKPADERLYILTHYEKMHLANELTIKYVSFMLQ